MWITYFLSTDLGAVGIFGVSFATAVVAAIVVGVLGVETKGKTLEEINDGVFEKN